jgi:hypothetical protein
MRIAVPISKEGCMPTPTPELPPDVDRSTEHKGSAVGTPGLNGLDEEREASLADEGGASGATVETQDDGARRHLRAGLPVGHLQRAEERRAPRSYRTGLVVAGAAAVLAALVLRRR